MEVQAKPDAQIAASPVPPQAASAASFLAGGASEVTKPPERSIAMTDVVESPSQEFLLSPLNLNVLDASIRDEFIEILSVVNMVHAHAFMELLPPTPSIHNELVELFRNQESSGLPGALAAAIERSELTHKTNLARLTEIKGYRVKVNLNLSPPTSPSLGRREQLFSDPGWFSVRSGCPVPS
jgi:hypothetical protein